MGRRDNITKNKSIYTISKKHMISTAGTIYEKDHVTIIPNDGIFDEVPKFSDSNFKFRIGSDKNDKKRHSRGVWVKPDDEESGITWTLSNLSGHVTTEETKIVNKPNYSSMKDFAYYGSAVELLQATVNDIILRFPGGLSYYGAYAPKVTEGDKTYYLVSNEFNIDFYTTGDVFSGDVKNPLRVLCAGYAQYVDRNGNQISSPIVTITGDCLESIIGTVNIIGDDEIFYIYLNGDGKKLLVTDRDSSDYTDDELFIIRPNETVIKEFWNTLDDFERVLLNRDSEPVYKAVFDTPYMSDDGYYFVPNNYIWPTVGNDGFTPDITTGAFQGYLEKLRALAEFHDEYDSDNILRMYTHEPIKNLDWTFINQNDDDTDIDADFDASRIKAMLHVWGRQFDDLKLYTENVKASNTITYDEKNNVPDYFLTDKVELNGWEARTVSPTKEETPLSDTISGETETGEKWVFEKAKKPADVNIKFMRRLALCSPYINALKGTRRGLITILNMFGYTEDQENKEPQKEGTFNISEYVSVAHYFPDYGEMSRLRGTAEYLNYDGNDNFMVGYPVVRVTPSNPEAEDYLIPWFDPNEQYRDPLYFQQNGGWGRFHKKVISLPITTLTEIEERENFRLYSETESYMKFATDLNDLRNTPNSDLIEGMVCYVSDISGLEEIYVESEEDRVTWENYPEKEFSHYFILKKKALSQTIGYLSNEWYDCYGWRNIYNIEYNGMYGYTDDGLRVLYLESLSNEHKGNNPHIGNGEYDDGKSYIDRYNILFSEALKDGIYDFLKDSQDESDRDDYAAIATSGFCASFLEDSDIDNKKSHYFEDTEAAEPRLACLQEEDGAWVEVEDENRNNWDEDFFDNLSIPEQETVTSKHDEAAANSVINIKNIVISFGTGGNQYLREYIEKVVIKYLETMIPSTTIVRYRFDSDTSQDITG